MPDPPIGPATDPWRQRRVYAVVAAAWVAATVLTHVPPFWSDDGPPRAGGVGPDKLLHLVGYFGLAVLTRWALATAGVRRASVVTVAGLLAWGVIDELTQPPFGRSADALDYAADVVGTLLGVAAAAAIGRWRRRPGGGAGLRSGDV